MTRQQFKKCVREVEAVWELSGRLSDVGIETIDCKELSYASDILAEWIEDSFGPEGKDLVSWWMYEDVEKVVYEEDGSETNLENIDDLYSYLEKFYGKR